MWNQVVIVQMNGEEHPSESVHVLHVGKMRMKLCKDNTTMAKEFYSPFMQVISIPFSKLKTTTNLMCILINIYLII